MDALTIIQLAAALMDLSSKYISIAQQTGELTPEETAEFNQNLKNITESAAWKIEPDPEN